MINFYNLKKVCLARVIQPISYHNILEEVKLEKGTVLLVDIVKKIAYFQGDHFAIEDDEYISYLKEFSQILLDKKPVKIC